MACASLGTAGSAPARDDGARLALWQKATRDGSVRVIARLALPETAQAQGGREPVSARRAAIAAAQSRVATRLAGRRARVRHAFETLPYVALDVDPVALLELEESGLILDLQEDRAHAPMLRETRRLVRFGTTVDAGLDGSGQAVAIVDSGVDATHPFLEGRVVYEECIANGGACPNGGDHQQGPGAAEPCRFNPSECKHGTHVAGIAAGRSPSITGVAPGADVIAFQVFSPSNDCEDHETKPCARVFASDYVRALERVYDLRHEFSIAAVNLSLGTFERFADQGECDRKNAAVKDAIDRLRSVGIATVAASGNASDPSAMSSPACLSSAISVGATTKRDAVAPYSNRAPFLDLLAPGSGIESSVPGGAYGIMYGTSMAAPHVAGAWAALRQLEPDASVDRILDVLESSGRWIGDEEAGMHRPIIDVQLAADFLGGDCGCRVDTDSYCGYAPSSPSCPMTFPGGYCDPNGDGDFSDADWARGYEEFQTTCNAPDEPTPTPRQTWRSSLAPIDTHGDPPPRARRLFRRPT